MKQFRMLLIGLITGALLMTAGTGFAADIIEKVTASVRTDYTVTVDGKKAELKNAPLAYNGASYLPVRELAELLGTDVDFVDGEIQLTTSLKEGVNLNDLIVLRDLKDYGITVSHGPFGDYENVLRLQKGETIVDVLDFLPPENKSEHTYEILGGGVIAASFKSGTTYLQKSKLVDLGLIN